MPLQLGKIAWMPSPPLAPMLSPVDDDHLARMSLGDRNLAREVLALFAAQAPGLVAALIARPSEAPQALHTLKGSARGIGAFAVSDAAEAMEDALRQNGERGRALRTLQHAVDAACEDIAERLDRP